MHVTISRIEDIDSNVSNLNAIRGVKTTPKLSLVECVETALNRVTGLSGQRDLILQLADDAIMLMKKIFKQEQTLTVDEAAAVYAYTQDTPFYIELNRTLRVLDRELITPFFPFMRLLLDGLHKLPLETCTVYRGIRPLPGSAHDFEFFKKTYSEDTEFVWWTFTSTSSTLKALSLHKFHGDEGERIKFIIETRSAIDISLYSAFPSEGERIILPGTKFKVVSCLDSGHGLYEIQIKEVATRVPYIDHPHPGWIGKK